MPPPISGSGHFCKVGRVVPDQRPQAVLLLPGGPARLFCQAGGTVRPSDSREIEEVIWEVNAAIGRDPSLSGWVRLPCGDVHVLREQYAGGFAICEKSTEPGVVPCDSALLLGDGQVLPEHVCASTLRKATRELALEHGSIRAKHSRDVWCNAWPLPLGAESIYSFAQLYRLPFLDLAGRVPEVHGRSAYLGLVVNSNMGGSTLRMLGIVEPRDGASLQAWQWFDPETWTTDSRFPESEWPDDDLGLFNDVWQWRDAIFVLDGHDESSASVLDQLRERLECWYGTIILGRRRRGRPPRTGTYPSRDACQQEIRAACKELWEESEGRYPADLQRQVADRLHVHIRTLQDNLTRFHIRWEDVSRPPD